MQHSSLFLQSTTACGACKWADQKAPGSCLTSSDWVVGAADACRGFRQLLSDCAGVMTAVRQHATAHTRDPQQQQPANSRSSLHCCCYRPTGFLAASRHTHQHSGLSLRGWGEDHLALLQCSGQGPCWFKLRTSATSATDTGYSLFQPSHSLCLLWSGQLIVLLCLQSR